ncbi:carboxypeptidase regulatory-like domain-containing protein [Arthrobacter sp. ISL-48]|uniref:MSCRAMM family protein n=1 Tax=Arthrobacter sp. ISL-48 TaxID=2819110 RepID=UPI001BEB6C42|nr:carboxypeptidase-like regulatory domain-containing protein [Arthrobacter sp. ISL-48]MBT2532983.1 carboxypeptidase regulatory-like domain-containing protein [Arthrobacter sp. ISL-48]
MATMTFGPAAATADDYNPVSYVEGVVTAPAGTQLDQLKVHLTPVQGALWPEASVSADGRFRVPYSWLNLANLVVSAGDTGLADTWYGNVSRQEEATTIALGGRSLKALDVTMSRGSTISGRISLPLNTDATQLTVVAESLFTAPWSPGRTATKRTGTVSANGSYSVSGLGANNYTVRVQPGASGLLETWYGGGVDKKAAKSLEVGLGSSITGVDIQLTKPASLSGRAIFPEGSVAEPGYVAMYSEAGNKVAGGSFGADGVFSLPQVPSGSSKISFGVNSANGPFATLWYPQAGAFPSAEPLILGPGESKTGLNLSMAPAGSVSGNVTGTGGSAVSVWLLDSLGRRVSSASTDAAGNYVVSKVGPGTFKVRFSQPPAALQSSIMTQFYPGVSESAGYQAGADVTVALGQATAGINANMTPGGTITGIIQEAAGKPLESHTLRTLSSDGSVAERRAHTDRSGRFVIAGLADGDYVLETNVDPYADYLIPLGHIYSGNVRDRDKAQTISIRNGQTVDAGTLSYDTAGKTASSAAGKFVPIPPTRILDTRTLADPLPYNTNQVVQISGKAGIPADASAVALNLTVTEPTSYGNVAAFPFGQLTPNTSNVNFVAHQTVPNYVVVPIKDGRITLANAGYDGTTHLIADVAGYFTGGLPADSGAYQPVTPYRAADSRGTGATAGGQVFDIQMVGLAPLPPEVGAVVVNITAARVWTAGSETSYGHLTAYGSGTSLPSTSNVNYESTRGDVPNLAVVPVGADGKINIANTSPGSVGIVVDVMGYFLKGTASTAGSFQSLPPKRLIDTRTNSLPVGAGKDITVAVGGVNGVPAGAKAAMINLTVTEPKSYGHLTAYPAGQPLPATSNVNYSAGQTVANFAMVPIGADGKITVRNTSSDSSHVIVDIVGYING